MKRWLTGMLCAIAPLLAVHSESESTRQASPLLGYGTQASVTEVQWETRFRDGISPDGIRENMRRLSARPHHV